MLQFVFRAESLLLPCFFSCNITVLLLRSRFSRYQEDIIVEAESAGRRKEVIFVADEEADGDSAILKLDFLGEGAKKLRRAGVLVEATAVAFFLNGEQRPGARARALGWWCKRYMAGLV